MRRAGQVLLLLLGLAPLTAGAAPWGTLVPSARHCEEDRARMVAALREECAARNRVSEHRCTEIDDCLQAVVEVESDSRDCPEELFPDDHAGDRRRCPFFTITLLGDPRGQDGHATICYDAELLVPRCSR